MLALREPHGHVSGASAKRTVVKTIASTPGPRSGSASHPTSGASSPSAPSTTHSSTPSPPTSGQPKTFPLIVLNNTTTARLASQAAQRFEQGGWRVTKYGNLPGNITDIVSTCAYYDPNVSGAQAAADALQQQYPTIKRVKEKFADLPTGPLVVVLTPDYSAA